jgi:hypothetical protein
MSAPFVTTLRARPEGIRLAPPDANAITVRVQIPELWDAVRIEASPAETVLAVKVAALAALEPGADQRDYVMKLRGFEMLDEQHTLTQAGAVDGSIFLLTHRRRRPVR